MATKKDRDKKKQRADKAKKQYNKNKGNRPTRKSNTAAGNKAEKAAYAKQKVQDAATARRQAGISIKDTIRDNRQAVKDFATNQHQKFKQTGVQTQGGTRSSDSYSTKEKKSITDAGYSTKSYGTDKARSDTDVQVSRDNARYGNTFPAGAFSISKPAYSQAEQPRFKDGQLVASSMSGGSYGGYVDAGSARGFVSPEQADKMIKNPEAYKMRPSEIRYLRESLGLPRAQTLPGQEVAKFAAADLSNFEASGFSDDEQPTRRYGYPSQQEVDDAVAQGTAGFIPSDSLNINKPTTEEAANPLSRALQIAGDFGKEVMSDPLGYAKTLGGFLSDITRPQMVADGTLTGNMDLAGRLPGDAGFNMNDVTMKGNINAALNSETVNQFGQMKGLPSDFQAQTREALSALDDNFRGATADRDGVYSGVSETLRTLNQDPRLKPVSKFLGQLGTDNENVSDAERNQNFKIAGVYNTPFSNETVADVVSSFQPNVSQMRELSKEERGRLVGGIGNRLVSGKFTDAAREALTGYNPRQGFVGPRFVQGENLGLERGTPLSIANTIDAGRMMMKNFNTEGTLANRRFTEIGNLADPSGRITTPSLIRGTLGIGRRRGRGSSRAAFGSGFLSRLPDATTTPQEVVEFIQDTLPSEVIPEFTDPTDSYNATLNQYLTNPNYFPEVQQYTPPVRTSFKQTFNRDYY